MKIGISTACFYPLKTEEALEFLGKNNIPVTEIFFNSHSEVEDEFVELLNEIRLKYNIEINSLHACGSVGEPYYLFSEYERRYLETREFYKKYYMAAKKLGAKTVVLHGDSLKGHIPFEEYAKRLCDMNEDAAQYGVTLSHENVNKFRMAVTKNVETLKTLTGGKQPFTFDVKQCIRAGVDVYDMLKTMGENIVNVHISDNSPSCDCLLPGDGQFDFARLFKELQKIGYDGTCLIEVYRWSYNEYADLLASCDFVKKFTVSG